MPGNVGFIRISSIGGSSVLNVGDVNFIMPVSTAKTFAGAGSFNTGDGLSVYNQHSVTNVQNNNQLDQPIIGNI
ncbi:MAG: spore germination protein [Bacillaceae bacterium]